MNLKQMGVDAVDKFLDVSVDLTQELSSKKEEELTATEKEFMDANVAVMLEIMLDKPKSQTMIDMYNSSKKLSLELLEKTKQKVELTDTAHSFIVAYGMLMMSVAAISREMKAQEKPTLVVHEGGILQ